MDKSIILSILSLVFVLQSEGQKANSWQDEASGTWLDIVEYAPDAVSPPSPHFRLLEELIADIQKGKIKFYKSPKLLEKVKPSEIFYKKEIQIEDVFKLKAHFRISYEEKKNAFVFDPVWGLQSVQDTSKVKKTIWAKAYASDKLPDIKNKEVDFAATCNVYLDINPNNDGHHAVMEDFYKHCQENYDKLENLNLIRPISKQPVYGHYIDSILVVHPNLESYRIKTVRRSYSQHNSVEEFKLNGLWFYNKSDKKLCFKELSLIPRTSRQDEDGKFLYSTQDFKYIIDHLDIEPQKNIIYKNRVEVDYLKRSGCLGIRELPSHVSWPDTGLSQLKEMLLAALEKNEIPLYTDSRLQKSLSSAELKKFLIKETGKELLTEIKALSVIYETAYDTVAGQYLIKPAALKIYKGEAYDSPSLWMKIETMQKLPDLDKEEAWGMRIAGNIMTSAYPWAGDRENHRAINKGCQKATKHFYTKYYNSEAEGPITDKEGNKIKNNFKIFEVDTIVTFDPETFEEIKQIKKTYKINIAYCYDLRLVNWWYFDKKKATLFMKNQACAHTRRTYHDSGNYSHCEFDFYYWYVLPK